MFYYYIGLIMSNEQPADLNKMMNTMTELGINDTTALLQMMLKTQSVMNQQNKKEAKQVEKEKKQKERMKPRKELKHIFRSMRKVEKIFDITEKVENDTIRKRIINWLYNGLEPYNSFLTGEKGKTCFKNNSIGFLKLIQQVRGTEDFGVLTSSVNRGGRERFFLKTEHGILTGRQANLYLRYILKRKCLDVIQTIAGKKMKELGDKGSIDDCFVQLSFFQLFSSTSIDAMVKYIINESYDKQFAKTYYNATRIGCADDFISELPSEVRREIIGTPEISCDFSFSDTDSSTATGDSDTDEDDGFSSDSDSD